MQCFSYSIAIIIDSFTAFGNELSAAKYLYQDLNVHLPNKYVNDISTCYIYDPWCFRGKNSDYGMQVKVWNPTYLIDPEKDLYYRKAKDCTYEIKQTNWSNTMNHRKYIRGDEPLYWEIFEFTMIQSNCQENITRANFSKTGGSTFTSIGYNNESLIACTSTDYLNAYYKITCRFPKYYHISNATSEKYKTCMNLTVVLEYEHFDGYSAVLGSNSHDDYLYPPIKYLVADDVEWCVEFPLQSINQIPQIPATREYLLDLNGTGMTSYFTGYWLNQETTLQKLHSLYTLYKDRLVMAFEYYSKVNRINYYSVVQLPSPKLLTKFLSSQLVFKPFLLRNYEHNQYFSDDRDHLETILTHNYSHIYEHHFHLIGASHMRYNFNYLVGLLYGEDKLPDARKYNEEHVETFHTKGAEKESLLVSEIERLCTSDFEYSHYTYDPIAQQRRIHTLVFQFGAWDLQASPLELLVDTSGVKLAIAKIFSDPGYCKNLVHLIYITAVPYPLCYDESDRPCYQLRGMSNNGAISALNRHTIKELLELKRQFKDSVKLSIIDAYSIIKPRILLDNFNEVTCSFHYLCREKLNGKYQNIATIGGIAVVEALLRLFREPIPISIVSKNISKET